MSKADDPHQKRLQQILERLETRAQQCPGMFPVTSPAHWQQLALLHEPAGKESVEQLWLTLEAFDRNPELSHQALNQLLAQQSAVQLMSVDTNPKNTARQRQQAIEDLLAPDAADYNFKQG